MAPLGVSAPAQQRDASAPCAPADVLDRFLRLGPLQAGEISRDVLLPRDLRVEELAQERWHRAELLQPHTHALLADAARPEPHDEDAIAILGRGRLVDALGDDVAGGHRVVSVKPPSITSVWPVTQRASSLAR